MSGFAQKNIAQTRIKLRLMRIGQNFIDDFQIFISIGCVYPAPFGQFKIL